MLWVEVQGGSTMLGLNGKEIKARMATNNTSGIRLGTIPKFTRFLGYRPCRATCILRQSRYDYVSHQKHFPRKFHDGIHEPLHHTWLGCALQKPPIHR